MSWVAALLALLISHAVGDVLLQTDWQAIHKSRGLTDPMGRRALVRHVATYMVAFIPTLIWIGDGTSLWHALSVGALVALPHLLIDDGTLLRFWSREIKRTANPALGLMVAIDQSFHLLCLFGAALVASG